MFIFYVVLTGYDMVTDAGRATTCRRNFKAPSLQTNITKIEGPPENMGFDGEMFEDFRQKKSRNTFLTFQKNQGNTRLLNTTIEIGPCKQEEVKRRKIGKSIQIKTVGTLQD